MTGRADDRRPTPWRMALLLAAAGLGGCYHEPDFDRSSSSRSTEVSDISNRTGADDGREARPGPLTGDDVGRSMRSAAARPPQ